MCLGCVYVPTHGLGQGGMTDRDYCWGQAASRCSEGVGLEFLHNLWKIYVLDMFFFGTIEIFFNMVNC